MEVLKEFSLNFAVGTAATAIGSGMITPLMKGNLMFQTGPYPSEFARYKGTVKNMIKTFPGQALCFAVKDSAKRLFPVYNHTVQFSEFLAVQLLSGAIGGAVPFAVVYPFHQTRNILLLDMVSRQGQYTGFWDCMTKTVTGPKGFFALYKNFGTTVCGTVGSRSLYFGLYDGFREKNPFKEGNHFVSFISRFGLALATSNLALYLSHPFETVRRRLYVQSQEPKEKWIYSGTMDCFAKIIQQESFMALFKGARDVVGLLRFALCLAIYDSIQIALKEIG